MKANETNKSNFIEWGKDPEDGMILVGFSCSAVLEGNELKSRIIASIRKGPLGIREAVQMLKDEGMANFDEAKRVVLEIKNDLAKKGQQGIFSKPYLYSINKVYWAYEENIPEKDPRYFKLNVVDCNSIDEKRYLSEDKSFNASRFVKDFMPEEEIRKRKKRRENEIKEIVPDLKEEIIDPEINDKKRR